MPNQNEPGDDPKDPRNPDESRKNPGESNMPYNPNEQKNTDDPRNPKAPPSQGDPKRDADAGK